MAISTTKESTLGWLFGLCREAYKHHIIASSDDKLPHITMNFHSQEDSN